MPSILFTEDTHEYILDGEVVDSVTTIVRSALGKSFPAAAMQAVERKRLIGNEVHRAIIEDLSGGEPEVSMAAFAYLRSYRLFTGQYEIHRADVLFQEKILASARHRFAGTVDLGLARRGVLILDWKTQTVFDIPYVKAQLGGYALAYEETAGVPPSHLWAVHLTPKQGVGAFKVEPFKVDEAVGSFLTCLETHRSAA